jgi:aromatic ring-opening dioxygenase LigB subunit
MGCVLKYNDPAVDGWQVDGTEIERVTDLATGCSEADAVIIVQPHSVYLDNDTAITESGTPVLDATGKFRGALVELL